MNAPAKDPATAIIERLDELILTIKGRLLSDRWIGPAEVANMLGYGTRTFAERIALRADFPKAMRIDGDGNPRWLFSEVMEWARAQQEASHRKPKRGRPRTTREVAHG